MGEDLGKVNRDLRRAKRMARALSENGMPVKIDPASIETLQASLINGIEKAFEGKLDDLKAEQKLSIDPASISELQVAVTSAVSKMPVPVQQQQAKPVSYRINSIVTDREGNILSADIHPIED
jgi:hypothetical protein